MTAGPATLEVRGVRRTFRRGPEAIHALDDVNFTLDAGELVALLGPSGSGKSTLLNVLSGWEQADEGTILWQGEGVKPQALLWKDVAVVPQSLGLLEELTVLENVELPVRLSGGLGTSDDAHSLLDGLGLASLHDRFPHEISLGEQQRTALARALVLSPRLLLADEPTAHQDSVWARGIFRVLDHAKSRGTAVLVATHNREVLKFVARTLYVRDGILSEDPLPADLTPKKGLLNGPHQPDR